MRALETIGLLRNHEWMRLLTKRVDFGEPVGAAQSLLMPPALDKRTDQPVEDFDGRVPASYPLGIKPIVKFRFANCQP